MTVYIVRYRSDRQIFGVFETNDAAEAYVAAQIAPDVYEVIVTSVRRK